MRQTLFYIPHQIGDVPMFGWGLALVGWLLFSVITFVIQARRHGLKRETWSTLPVMIVVSVVIVFVLPHLEVIYKDRPIGIPIRGYGVMLLAGIVAGVGLAATRAQKMGISPEVIFSLAFSVFIAGIIGARLFYVIQKWDDFRERSMIEIVNLTNGGLVVYGALIFALVAALWFFHRNRLPVLAMADLIAPSLIIGLALGRIGCLMNGCCYGGLCTQPWALTFPPDSPPYVDQHQRGLIHGIRVEADADGLPVLTWVDPTGPAAEEFADIDIGADGAVDPPISVREIRGSDILTDWNALSPEWQSRLRPIDLARSLLNGKTLAGKRHPGAGPDMTLVTDDGRIRHWSIGEFPLRSRPVHPTQIYSSINAFLLFLVVLCFYPFRRRDGEVIVLLLSLYAVSRFLLEVIRTDEGAVFGTGLTISQNVSLLLLIGTVALYFSYIVRQPKGSVLPLRETEKK